ncbi:hypothetical protein [Spiroplasma ixodetis]|uniref:hypothetical protein n=1 Tax=Spiroplasma ixodetis TaxID=2141 RepID=UPI002576743A|nr:hypothetical protein [Spiroplasma ixodetis]WJG69326.1 hypothetical protein SIXOD_v1c01690 [Spiroplasma ixodetis Y32]
MENKNNIDWNVNLNYITKDDLKTFYKFVPDEDQTTTDENKTDLTGMAIAIASERINTITGNQIEVIGFKNLNETQQTLVKRATARMTLHYLTDGMSFIRSSVSISGNGLSSSISPPSEPDYVLMEVYNLLQQANLHTPRKAINNPISCNTDNFNTPSIFDESDTRVITWDSGNKTFLQKKGIIAGTGIKIDDVSDTIPKLKLNVDANIDSLWEVNKDNSNFINAKDDKGISANDKRIIDVGTPTFLTDATNKEYVDKKQDKLIAGTNITIDENNKISATGGSADLSDYYKKEEINKKLEDKMDKDQFQYAFLANVIGSENPTLETTNKTVAGAINELKEKIKDKKFSNDYFKYNTETNEILLNDEENSLLCKDLLENNEYKILKTQNKKLLQAINEILEKQPQPSPSSSNWKEVGTREKNKWDNWQITYDFQENKHYRVYYSWSIYNPVYTIQEFIITDKKIAGVPIQTFNDIANIVILSVQHAKWITIYTVKGNLKGNVWKLEELQE